jgi:hypothetical protein
MTLHEPMTFATDMVLGALTAYFAVRLLGEAARTGSPPLRLWGIGFAASAAAALTGGVYHGFRPQLGPVGAAALWKVTVLSVGLTSAFLLASAARAALAPPLARLVVVLAAIQLGVYAAWMTTHNEFRYVIYDYGSAMIAVAALHAYRLFKDRSAPGAAWILGGIAVSFAAAAVQHSGLALHRHFNHNDLYHVVQMAATALLYRGGLSLRLP